MMLCSCFSDILKCNSSAVSSSSSPKIFCSMPLALKSVVCFTKSTPEKYPKERVIKKPLRNILTILGVGATGCSCCKNKDYNSCEAIFSFKRSTAFLRELTEMVAPEIACTESTFRLVNCCNQRLLLIS